MKRGTFSEALNNIPEEFKLEALELHNQSPISVVNNMNKKKKSIITVAIAASFVAALGATAAATGLFGSTKTKTPETGETIALEKSTYNESQLEEMAAAGIDPEVLATINDDYSYVVTDNYDHISQQLFFEGPTKCNEIEFKVNELPEGYSSRDTSMFGNPNDWTNYLQVTTEDDNALTFQVFYTPQLGPDGFLYTQSTKADSNTYDVGDNHITELRTYSEGAEAGENKDESDFADYATLEEDENGTTWLHFNEAVNSNYYIMYNNAGYIIVISGHEDMETLKALSESIEIRTTDREIEYSSEGVHQFCIDCAVG